MGCDLIGFFAFVPEGSARLVNRHLDRIDELVVREWATGDAFATALGEAGVRVEEYTGDGQTMSDAKAALAEDIKLARDFTRFRPRGFNYRDGVEAEIKVNGKTVSILFAGEGTWGDEPDGAGYAMLRALYRVGVEDLMYRAIPWDVRRRKKHG